jgi:uncharacterized protein (DUF488 family)
MNFVYTIGFKNKNAQTFIELLEQHKIDVLFDIRLIHSSNLAGYAKDTTLHYILPRILSIEYVICDLFFPPKDLFRMYKSKKITWEQYTDIYINSINNKKAIQYFQHVLEQCRKPCFLCVEENPDKCHRRILVEFMRDKIEIPYQIEHL